VRSAFDCAWAGPDPRSLSPVAVGQSSAVFDFLCVCHKVMISGEPFRSRRARSGRLRRSHEVSKNGVVKFVQGVWFARQPPPNAGLAGGARGRRPAALGRPSARSPKESPLTGRGRDESDRLGCQLSFGAAAVVVPTMGPAPGARETRGSGRVGRSSRAEWGIPEPEAGAPAVCVRGEQRDGFEI
jgi:hypothetical protein